MFKGKLSLAGVSWVSLPKHGVAITRHNLPRLQGLPDEFLQLVLSNVIANLRTQLCHPQKHLHKEKNSDC